jgi:hypothetical protein
MSCASFLSCMIQYMETAACLITRCGAHNFVRVATHACLILRRAVSRSHFQDMVVKWGGNTEAKSTVKQC